MTDDIQSLFNQALAASRQKDFASARLLLKQLFKQDPKHLNGWLLAAHVVESRSDEIQCYKRVLQIDPNHAYARQKLAQLEAEQSFTPPVEPPSIRPTPAATGMTVTPAQPPSPKPASIQPAQEIREPVLETNPFNDSAATMKAGIYTLVGLLVVSVLCLIIVAIGSFTQTGGLFAEAAPTPTNDVLFNVLHRNAQAGEFEDLTAYMATIHPDSFMYKPTQELLPTIFADYDLTYQFYNLKVISADANEAIIQFSLVTRKRSGPEFRDNIVTGKMTLRPDKGIWKLYYQVVEDTSFEN